VTARTGVNRRRLRAGVVRRASAPNHAPESCSSRSCEIISSPTLSQLRTARLAKPRKRYAAGVSSSPSRGVRWTVRSEVFNRLLRAVLNTAAVKEVQPHRTQNPCRIPGYVQGDQVLERLNSGGPSGKSSALSISTHWMRRLTRRWCCSAAFTGLAGWGRLIALADAPTSTWNGAPSTVFPEVRPN
jgi:hypothetical protein